MLSVLPGPLHGAVMLVLLAANTLFWAGTIYLVILVKVVVPKGKAFDQLSRLASELAQTWSVINVFFVRHLMRVEWDIRLNAQLSREGQYLVCCNHQSWNDILVLMKAFGRRAPFFKFFIKQELIWVPVLGLAWWGLDYPFMKRYTPEQVAKNPALKGKDLDTTRKACERYRNVPVLILNFLEGTRFTAAKHERQQSPYKHLLKPKAGGFAFTVSAMGQRLDSLLDVTIVYPDGARGFWDFLQGKVRRVIVEVRQLQIPAEFFAGSYENDPAFRKRFQDWIAALWAQKDQRITEIRDSGFGIRDS
ncbi:MAG TPA: acyltransferase [Solimonas sp.]|nr:acyltransferase [Solimonas sp.]